MSQEETPVQAQETERPRKRLRMAIAIAAAILVVSPIAYAALSPNGPSPVERVTLVVAPDEEPQRVATTFAALSERMGMDVLRIDAADAAEFERAVEDAEHTLVVVAHGDETGISVGTHRLAWSSLAAAVNASPATGAVLVGCFTNAAARLIEKPVFGYDDLVDARIAELDAFEQAVYQVYGQDPAAEAQASAILWDHVADTYDSDSDLLLRFVLPQAPLYHGGGHNDPHHNEGNEYSYESENGVGMSGGLSVAWFKLKFDRQYCGSNRAACGAVAYLQIDAGKCWTIVSVYDLFFPGSGQAIREMAKQMGAEADVLALKLCGSAYIKVLDGGEIQGGGSLYLRFGTFVQFKKRWFMEIKFAAYIQGGFKVAVKSAHNDKHVYADWTFTVDAAVEGKLIYVYFNVNKNIAKGQTRMTICYRNCNQAGSAAAPTQGDLDFASGLRLNEWTTVNEATLQPGPALANHLEKAGLRAELGIPAGVPLTSVNLNLLHPAVDERFGSGGFDEAPSLAEPKDNAHDCPGPEGRVTDPFASDPNPDDEDGPTLVGYQARVCAEPGEEPQAQVTASLGNPFVASEGGEGAAWELLNATAPNQMQALYDQYADLRRHASAEVNLAEAWDDYAEKQEFDRVQLTATPNCFMTVIPPNGLVPPEVRNGPCFGDIAKSFYHQRPDGYTGDPDQPLYEASGRRLSLEGGWILEPESEIKFDTSCQGVFSLQDCP